MSESWVLQTARMTIKCRCKDSPANPDSIPLKDSLVEHVAIGQLVETPP